MREPDKVTVLECCHVQTEPGQCATIDCPNYDGRPTEAPEDTRKMQVASILASVLMLGYVRVRTGRGAIDIIMDSLPDLF